MMMGCQPLSRPAANRSKREGCGQNVCEFETTQNHWSVDGNRSPTMQCTKEMEMLITATNLCMNCESCINSGSTSCKKQQFAGANMTFRCTLKPHVYICIC